MGLFPYVHLAHSQMLRRSFFSASAATVRTTKRQTVFGLEMEDMGIFDGNNILSKASSDVLHQFLHACVDDICGLRKPTYRQFTNSVQWTDDEYNFAHNFICTILRNPAVLHLNAEKMSQEYSDLSKEVQKSISSCLSVRREQLLNALLKEHSKKTATTLTDFDWRLKWLMGSSKMATLKEPLLNLALMVEDIKDQQTVNLELNKDELELLINTLESAVC